MTSLSQALRLPPLPRLAFVGAGGKTSAMFQVGRELTAQFPAVLLTTTTHLGLEQVVWADHHLTGIPNSLDGLAGVVLVTSGESANQRVRGPDEAALERLRIFADRFELPLLVEADGSRRLPLKAPADHEPVIPGWVNGVVTVAGLDGLGQPLDEAYIQRAGRFAELSGMAPGGPVTVEALAEVLAHPHGGLKNIPGGARRVALLNQAETDERLAAARRLSGLLLPAYDSVVAAALNPPAPYLAGVRAVYEPAAGIILAAGEGRRMGRLKQVLEWRGRPLVTHVVQTALQAGLSPVIVVTGSQGDLVQAALLGLPVEVVHNPQWQEGQGGSVAAGVRALPEACGSAVFLLADQPHTPPDLVRGLVDRHIETFAPIVAPLIDGQRGNPVLFDRRTFAELAQLSGEAGGRSLFSRYPVTWLTWVDPAQALDVDTPEDFQRLLDQDGAQ